MIENVVLFDTRVSPLALRLYGALKHFAWKNEGAIPPQTEIAAAIGTTERSIRDAFKNLEAACLVTVERQQGTANIVWIEDPSPEDSSGEHRKNLPVTTPPSTRAREDLFQDSSLSSDRERPPRVDNSGDSGEGRSARGLVYDALVAGCYPAGAVLTPKEKKRVALAGLDIVAAGGTADDVRERIGRYKAHATYGGVALTAMSIASHWAELAPPSRSRASAPCPECEIGGGLHAAGCTRVGAS